MKKILLLALLAPTIFLACSKDDEQKIADSDCGALIGLDQRRKDGGVIEHVDIVACGWEWSFYKDAVIASTIKIGKGQTRATATYLVATKSDTVYIRYESGSVPQPTVDSFTNIGYTAKIATLTGLEHIQWP